MGGPLDEPAGERLAERTDGPAHEEIRPARPVRTRAARDEVRRQRRLARLRRRVHEVLEPGSHGPLAVAVDAFLIVLVLLNVLAAILESVPSVAAIAPRAFDLFEIVSAAIFAAEYGLRLWGAPEHAPWRALPPWRARVRLALRPQSLIDLAAILPVALALFESGDELRGLLVLRLFRFFKLARYSPGLASLAEAIYAERRALLASGLILLGTVLVAATFMHLVERHAQPDRFGTIPDAMYWATVTVTTVGYGDVVPVTPLGKIVAGLTAVTGLVMLALPVGIIATAFAREIDRRDFVVTWTMVTRVPLFAGLATEEIGAIMRRLRSQSAEPGELIVVRGEAADAMYLLAAGEVEIDVPSGPVRLGAGHFFGEIGLLEGLPRTATVTARTACKLLALDAAELRLLMDRSPVMQERIRAVAAERLAATRGPG